jgi:hypothetical protein
MVLQPFACELRRLNGRVWGRMTIDDVLDDLTEIIRHPVRYGLDPGQLALLAGARRRIEQVCAVEVVGDEDENQGFDHLAGLAV